MTTRPIQQLQIQLETHPQKPFVTGPFARLARHGASISCQRGLAGIELISLAGTLEIVRVSFSYWTAIQTLNHFHQALYVDFRSQVCVSSLSL